LTYWQEFGRAASREAAAVGLFAPSPSPPCGGSVVPLLSLSLPKKKDCETVFFFGKVFLSKILFIFGHFRHKILSA
jgi:hypothetical protein